MDNLGFGLGVTVVGLGIVFGLLGGLWLLLAVAVRLDAASGAHPESMLGTSPSANQPDDGSDPEARSAAGRSEPALDPGLVAAITVAVIRHGAERRRQAAPAMRSHQPGSLLFASRWVDAGRMRQGQPWRRRAR